jgi:hypothetical protein
VLDLHRAHHGLRRIELGLCSSHCVYQTHMHIVVLSLNVPSKALDEIVQLLAEPKFKGKMVVILAGYDEEVIVRLFKL